MKNLKRGRDALLRRVLSQDWSYWIDESKFGYLSEKDRLLLRHAIILRCEAFLTVESRLPRNAAHIERELGIRILTPITYWEILRPWAALWR